LHAKTYWATLIANQKLSHHDILKLAELHCHGQHVLVTVWCNSYLCSGVFGEPLEVMSEEDVFDYINMDYKAPHERSM